MYSTYCSKYLHTHDFLPGYQARKHGRELGSLEELYFRIIHEGNLRARNTAFSQDSKRGTWRTVIVFQFSGQISNLALPTCLANS